MVHHMQNLEGRLNNITTQNTNEDGDLPKIEEEAYKLGNMMLRKWEDSIKSEKYLKEYKQYVLTELFEKDLSNIEKISPLEYIVGDGKDIEAINLLRGNKHTALSEAETIIQMMEQGGAQMIYHGMTESDVKAIMQYPFNMFASDAGIAMKGYGKPHPRAYGTNSRVLGRYVRTMGVLSLEEAIRRMTSLPANKFNIAKRGIIQEGYFADIVVFDADEVSSKDAPTDRATIRAWWRPKPPPECPRSRRSQCQGSIVPAWRGNSGRSRTGSGRGCAPIGPDRRETHPIHRCQTVAKSNRRNCFGWGKYPFSRNF
jgi:hypothetical protein